MTTEDVAPGSPEALMRFLHPAFPGRVWRDAPAQVQAPMLHLDVQRTEQHYYAHLLGVLDPNAPIDVWVGPYMDLSAALHAGVRLLRWLRGPQPEEFVVKGIAHDPGLESSGR